MTEGRTAIGPRLRTLRQRCDMSQSELARQVGTSPSMIARIETGRRPASIDLLLRLAEALRVPIHDLVGAPDIDDPRINNHPLTRDDATIVPLSRFDFPVHAFQYILPPAPPGQRPHPQTHPGHDWMYVLSGRLRLMTGPHDLVLAGGEAAEFDARVPHWFGNAGPDPVEFLALFGPQGQRAHVGTSPKHRPAAREPPAIPDNGHA